MWQIGWFSKIQSQMIYPMDIGYVGIQVELCNTITSTQYCNTTVGIENQNLDIIIN